MANPVYYNVKNRSASRVCYSIAEDHIRRVFAPGETKKIPYDELLKLTWQPGGREMMVAFLQIDSQYALDNFNIKAQPEYYLSENQIIDLLKHGSLDAFLDCLDFAPIGVIDLIKKYSVSLPLSDYEKKKALKAKYGYDIDAILSNIEEDVPEEKEKTSEKVAAAPAGRRTTPNYNIVSKK